MIQLHQDCLWMQDGQGKGVPMSASHLTIELMGEAAEGLDPELVREAAAGVLHYFKVELGRDFVTVGEFAAALAKVLNGFGVEIESADLVESVGEQVVTLDLRELASDCAKGFELAFFVRLRESVRTSLADAPRTLQFQGLRGCVMQLAGARRWSARCSELEERIVVFLRQCLEQEAKGRGCTMLVK